MSADEVIPEVSDPSELYSLPPENFTPARNLLSDRLRAEGKDEESQQVAQLRKPSIAAWALNRVARNNPELVERLTETHRRIREADTVAAMQEASDQRRKAVSDIAEAAATELTADGRPASAQTRDRISNTVLAVATDPEGEADLISGTLVRELEPSGSGWGDFALTPPPAPDPDQVARDELADLQVRAAKLAEKAVEAEHRLELAEKTVADARRRSRQARADADEAAEEVRRAEAAAKEK